MWSIWADRVGFYRVYMSGEGDSPPSDKNPRAFGIVEKAVEEHLRREFAWPRTIFEFELRGAGVYPDFTGRSLEELYKQGKLGEQIESNGRKYFTRPDEGAQPSPIIEESVEKYYSLLDEVGNFGELVAYATLCEIYGEYTAQLHHVLPEQNQTHRLQGIQCKSDAFLEYGHKCTPVEVYNGTEYIGAGHRKVRQQMLPVGSLEDPHSRPLLIAPFASEDAEETILDGHGVIAQTGKPIVCNKKLQHYSKYLDYLSVKSNFKFIPPITTKDNREIDGEMYNDILGSPDFSMITPDKIKADRVPNEYVKRVRGGFQFTYVASLYQEADSTLSEYACLVLQPLFHHLLRKEALSMDELITFGWEDLKERYPQVKANAAKDAVLERTKDYIEELANIEIIEQNGKSYSTYQSHHPHISLSLDQNLPM